MDTLGFGAGDVNFFRWEGNNTINGSDPLGLADDSNIVPGDASGKESLADFKAKIKELEANIDAAPTLKEKQAIRKHLKKWEAYEKVTKRNPRDGHPGGGRRGAVDGRLATALGATAITVMVGMAYDSYVSTGEEAGTALATQVGLSRALQILGVAEMLPDGNYFNYTKPDGTIIHVNLVQQDDQWYFTAYHYESTSHLLFWEGGQVPVYDIRLGQAPAYHTPNAPQLPQDIAGDFGRVGTVTILGRAGACVRQSMDVTSSSYLYWWNTYGRYGR